MVKLRPKLAELVLKLVSEQGFSEKEVSFITDAADEVCESLRVVSNTYIYRFFAHGDVGEALYRMQQLDLNRQLGELQEMLEGRHVSAEEKAKPEFRGVDFVEPAFKVLVEEPLFTRSQVSMDNFMEERKDINDRTKRMARFRFEI